MSFHVKSSATLHFRNISKNYKRNDTYPEPGVLAKEEEERKLWDKFVKKILKLAQTWFGKKCRSLMSARMIQVVALVKSAGQLSCDMKKVIDQASTLD